MASQQLVELNAGNLRLELSPSIGGSISAFEWIGGAGARPILRKCNTPLEKVLEGACFPLVPFVNRVRGGRFRFRDREVRIAPNMAGDPNPLHGQGWLSPWTVDDQDRDRASLSFRHSAGEWPWDYLARQEFTLDDQGFTAVLTCTNMSQWPMPCGLGQHPYFPCGPETRIDTKVTDVWTIDELALPVEKVPAAGRFDLTDRSACGQDLDHGFGGWGSEARLTDPAWPYELLLSSPDAHFFQIYSPRDGGFFCAEPVSHANAALNEPEKEWLELGLRVLDPGQTMTFTMRLEVAAK
jgi:aldose 1-epimerase